MNCETKKRGKLCGREECKPCFKRSFASHEKSKYLKKEHGNPLTMAKNSHKKYWFECEECEHSFEARLADISNGKFCPFCSNNKLCGSPECRTCFEKSFASHSKAEFWSTEKNIKNPREAFMNSNKNFWFECGKCMHSFKATLNGITRGCFCPFCSNKQLCSSNECKMCFEKSFASHKKVKFWSFEKNKQNPRELYPGTLKKFWFECGRCSHSFKTRLNDVLTGYFCPFCSNKQLCSSSECKTCFEKSFASHEKAEFWSFEKNKQIPREVFLSSHKKFWFECEKKHEFYSALYSISSGQWCPKCKNKTEAKLFSFLEENFKDPTHQFKVSWCKNPETDKHLPFDFCVSKTIIELDGPQHYRQVSNWKSPELTQKSDRYKEEQANKNGYSILRILQEDVWRDRVDWKSFLLENIKDYESPITKNLWETSP
ncbi:restriction endonuclease [Cannes 8 virus]|uniref:Restriction endonuclease n=1 Tax=Marseillevirus marseillevirus TaxID=694581 RepID=D2XAW9_GBMV|nr:restriction endonuclease [Marseillevirus marseillevirus]YP_009094790.1 conserved putative restriction endonuclease [Melbournevirus]AGV01692.1 restriction endonuclease [Cannes 8 virus]AVR53040.1 restriction endonuclease [Marseillevirus Shanghai 1]WRK65244.1 restriction endonuclease [Marseillevirus futianmevirus]ADB04096.1 restriction endonuclease [Marseillevirus marseillevirus]AIT54902.1 restriction endonuclease [Melbournevirus]